ncbi:MAG: hypothetical protein JJV97_04150 [SAR324 cluster bacterium]|nr:hypothetical protein [SAR324 cluster bacterium]
MISTQDIQDKAWENRLSDEKKISYFSQIKIHEKKRVSPSRIQLKFFYVSSPAAARQMRALFDYFSEYFTYKYGTKEFLKYLAKAQVEVHSPATWSVTNNRTWPSSQRLPASRFLSGDYVSQIEIVLPTNFAQVTSRKLNTLRLFIGDVIGKLLFDWQVLTRFPFQILKYQAKPIEFTSLEKAQIYRFFDDFNPNAKDIFKKIGNKYATHPHQKVRIGQALFFKQVIYNHSPEDKLNQQTNQGFIKIQERLITSYEDTTKKLAELLYHKTIRAKLFNPEDRVFLANLFLTKRAEFFHLVNERASVFYAGWLSALEVMQAHQIYPELFKELKMPSVQMGTNQTNQTEKSDLAKPGNVIGIIDLDGLAVDVNLSARILRNMQHSLQKPKLAREFLMPEEISSEEQNKEQLRFKLHIHQRFYKETREVKGGQKISAAKMNQQILGEYQAGAFQRLYNLCEYLKLILHKPALAKKHQHEFKKIVTWYVSHKSFWEDVGPVSTFALKMNRTKKDKNNELIIRRIKVFRSAWASFLGNALLIDNFNNNPKQQIINVNQVDNFKKIVYKTSLEELDSFTNCLTGLFLHIFRFLGEDLNKLFIFLSPGYSQLDSWILNGFPANLKSKLEILKMAKKISQQIK